MSAGLPNPQKKRKKAQIFGPVSQPVTQSADYEAGVTALRFKRGHYWCRLTGTGGTRIPVGCHSLNTLLADVNML